jgi:hypothetical protein
MWAIKPESDLNGLADIPYHPRDKLEVVQPEL